MHVLERYYWDQKTLDEIQDEVEREPNANGCIQLGAVLALKVLRRKLR